MGDVISAESATTSGEVRIGGRKTEPGFCREVEHLSGQKLSACYQCGECTAGCPVAFAMDLMPNQVTRMALAGMADEVLQSRSIWLCVGCNTCVTRCPHLVDLPRVMDSLRQIATRRGVRCPEPAIQAFHDTFLQGVERGGRLHELALVAALKLKTGRLFQDVPAGMAMMAKGKLAILPETPEGKAEVRRIFEECRRRAGEGDGHAG